jgi:dTDP-glucose 4,6-dehydratase
MARRRALVTGAAGFLGSHLCRRLLDARWDVVALDNFLSGRPQNVADLAAAARSFTFVEHDVTDPFPVEGPFDAVLHFASLASPVHYLAEPIATLEAGSVGTKRALDTALASRARFLLASTSEVYGDPLVAPQPERYLGNVSSTGPRSVYDEAKRYAEALTMAYHRTFGLDVKIARIFNTYGPRLRPDDGRVISNFLVQALRGEPLSVYGDGRQTRSFCYVDDEVRGIVALLESDFSGVMNLGNPAEITVLELAELVLALTGATGGLAFFPCPVDDPRRRCPDIALAREVLGWSPGTGLEAGLAATADWYRREETAALVDR